MRKPLVQCVTSLSRARSFHSSHKQLRQRLLWAGSVLDQSSATFKEVPKDWFFALGVQSDVEQGISFTGLASSASHTLLAFQTLPPVLPPVIRSDSNDEGPVQIPNPSGLHKVAAIGRNTYGELGLGFSSQESTWGMVSPGFHGAGGIRSVECGLGSSWIVTHVEKRRNSESLLYSFGNHTSGQLGLGGYSSPYALSEGGEPQLQLFSSPRRVESICSADVQIEAMSAGLDHTIFLTRHRNGSQSLMTCGINTDGQLGNPSIRLSSPSLLQLNLNTFHPPPPSPEEDPIVGVAAGGDSSMFWTHSGRVWAWGNSEYGQGLVQSKAIDRIDVPTEATQDLTNVLGAKVVDIQLGGSFSVLLDESGSVYTAGFGALGQGKDRLLSHRPQKILQNASRIFSGLEQAAAIVHEPRSRQNTRAELVVWGLDSPSGRLAVGSRKPYPSFMVASRFSSPELELRVMRPQVVSGLRDEWVGSSSEQPTSQGSGFNHPNKFQTQHGIVDVSLGRDVTFILVEDGTEETGRWHAKSLLDKM